MNHQEPLTHLMHKSIWLMDRFADALLTKHFQLSFSRFYVLAILGTIEPTTQHGLASCLGYSDAAVSRMVGALQEEGLLSQIDDPQHGRKHVVALTKEGREILAKCNDLLEREFDALLGRAALDKEEVRHAMQSIGDQLAQSL